MTQKDRATNGRKLITLWENIAIKLFNSLAMDCEVVSVYRGLGYF